MTIKDVLIMAQDEEIMEMLKNIGEIYSNMAYKTKYEKKTALREARELATEIQNKMIINKVFA